MPVQYETSACIIRNINNSPEDVLFILINFGIIYSMAWFRSKQLQGAM
jgi:hypothetical protein